MALQDVLIAADQLGLTDVILPFILVFTVVFAVLQKSKVLGVYGDGKPKANLNAMVAFVLAFFVLIMVRTLEVITWFARYVVLLLVAFVFLGILVSFLGVQAKWKGALMFVALALLSAVFVESLVWADILGADDRNKIILLLVLVAILGSAVALFRPKPKQTAEKTKQQRTEIPGLVQEKTIKPA
jgi:hypothetical protein